MINRIVIVMAISYDLLYKINRILHSWSFHMINRIVIVMAISYDLPYKISRILHSDMVILYDNYIILIVCQSTVELQWLEQSCDHENCS